MWKTALPGALVLALGAQSAGAMPHCDSRDDIIGALTENYSETHRASGLQSATGLLEIWASDESGSWTILLTRPDGQTCVMASGTHWLQYAPELQPDGEPA